MKNQANVISPREHNKLLVSPLKGKEIQDLLDIEFKIIAIEIIRELQENKINCDKIRNSIQEKNKNFNEEIENVKKGTKWKFWSLRIH